MLPIKPSIGSDPEFFIFLRKKKSESQQIISADKILPGKMNKYQTNGGKAFFDGVQAEINPDPNTCRESFINHIKVCLTDVYKLATNKYPNHIVDFAPLPSIKIKPEDVKGADNECLRFGCSPDSNIYTEEKIEYPDGKKFMTRFSGGHIHLGFNDIRQLKEMRDPDKLYNLVRGFDSIAGIISTAIHKDDESERIRRKWYGQAGTYRIQNHGIEYRTLSSFWLSNPFTTSLFTALIRDALILVYNKKEDEYLFDNLDENEVRRIINNGDYKNAIRIYKEVLLPMYDKINISGVPLTIKYIREFLKMLMEKGYSNVFSPYKMLNYWDIKEPSLNKFETTYGIRYLSKDYEHKIFNAKDIKTLGD